MEEQEVVSGIGVGDDVHVDVVCVGPGLVPQGGDGVEVRGHLGEVGVVAESEVHVHPAGVLETVLRVVLEIPVFDAADGSQGFRAEVVGDEEVGGGGCRDGYVRACQDAVEEDEGLRAGAVVVGAELGGVGDAQIVGCLCISPKTIVCAEV